LPRALAPTLELFEAIGMKFSLVLVSIFFISTSAFGKASTDETIDKFIDAQLEPFVMTQIKSGTAMLPAGTDKNFVLALENDTFRRIRMDVLKSHYKDLLHERFSPEELQSLLQFSDTPMGTKILREFLLLAVQMGGIADMEIIKATNQGTRERLQKQNRPVAQP